MAKRKTGRTSAAQDAEDLLTSSGFAPAPSGWRSIGPPESRKKTTRARRNSGRVSARRSTGRARAVATPKLSGHAVVPVVCSDCFEELAFDTGIGSETLTCPICEHSSARPSDEVLGRAQRLLGEERRNAAIALALTGAAGAAAVAWVLAQHDPANADTGMFWGPLGLAGLLALTLIVFAFRYEGNRWEVYF